MYSLSLPVIGFLSASNRGWKEVLTVPRQASGDLEKLRTKDVEGLFFHFWLQLVCTRSEE